MKATALAGRFQSLDLLSVLVAVLRADGTVQFANAALEDTVGLSRRTHRVLWQNIAFALGVKVLFFGLALAGSATLWMAVLADMGASLLVVANGLRLRRWRGQR